MTTNQLPIVTYINKFTSPNSFDSASPKKISITKQELSMDIINGWEAGFHSVFIPMITIMNTLSNADGSVSLFLSSNDTSIQTWRTDIFGALGIVSTSLGLPALTFAIFGLVATLQALAFHKENYRKNLTQFGNTLLRNLDLYTQLLELHAKTGIPLKFTEEYKVLLDDCFAYFFKYMPQENFFSVIQDINNNIISVQGFDYKDFCSNLPDTAATAATTAAPGGTPPDTSGSDSTLAASPAPAAPDPTNAASDPTTGGSDSDGDGTPASDTPPAPATAPAPDTPDTSGTPPAAPDTPATPTSVDSSDFINETFGEAIEAVAAAAAVKPTPDKYENDVLIKYLITRINSDDFDKEKYKKVIIDATKAQYNNFITSDTGAELEIFKNLTTEFIENIFKTKDEMNDYTNIIDKYIKKDTNEKIGVNAKDIEQLLLNWCRFTQQFTNINITIDDTNTNNQHTTSDDTNTNNQYTTRSQTTKKGINITDVTMFNKKVGVNVEILKKAQNEILTNLNIKYNVDNVVSDPIKPEIVSFTEGLFIISLLLKAQNNVMNIRDEDFEEKNNFIVSLIKDTFKEYIDISILFEYTPNKNNTDLELKLFQDNIANIFNVKITSSDCGINNDKEMCHIKQKKLEDKVYDMLKSGGVEKKDTGIANDVLNGITFISKFLFVQPIIITSLNKLCGELAKPQPTELYDFDTGDMLCKWSIIEPLFNNVNLKKNIADFHERIDSIYNEDTKRCFKDNKYKEVVFGRVHNLFPIEKENVINSINENFDLLIKLDNETNKEYHKNYVNAIRMALSRRIHITLTEHRVDLLAIATKRLHELGEGNIETNILTTKRDNFGSKESMSSLSILNGHLANLSSTMFTYFQMQLTSYILKHSINGKINAHSLNKLKEIQKSLYNIHETKTNIFGKAISENVDGVDDENSKKMNDLINKYRNMQEYMMRRYFYLVTTYHLDYDVTLFHSIGKMNQSVSRMARNSNTLFNNNYEHFISAPKNNLNNVNVDTIKRIRSDNDLNVYGYKLTSNEEIFKNDSLWIGCNPTPEQIYLEYERYYRHAQNIHKLNISVIACLKDLETASFMYKNQLDDKKMWINQKYFTEVNKEKYADKIIGFFTEILKEKNVENVENVEKFVNDNVNDNAKKKEETDLEIAKNSKVIFNIVKFIKEYKTCDTDDVPSVGTDDVPGVETDDVPGVGTGGVPGVETNNIQDVKTNKIQGVKINVKTIKSILIDFLYKEDDMYETFDFICKIYPFENDIGTKKNGGGIRKDFKCPTSFTFTSKPSPDVCKKFINVITPTPVAKYIKSEAINDIALKKIDDLTMKKIIKFFFNLYISGYYDENGQTKQGKNEPEIDMKKFVTWLQVINENNYIDKIRSMQNDPPFNSNFKSAFDKETIDKKTIDKKTIDKKTIDKKTILEHIQEIFNPSPNSPNSHNSPNIYILEPIIGNDDKNIPIIYKKEQDIYSYLQQLDKLLKKMEKYFCEESKKTEKIEKSEISNEHYVLPGDINKYTNLLKNDTFWLSEMHRIRKLHIKQGIIKSTTKPDNSSGNTYSADITKIGTWKPEFGEGIGRTLKRNIAIPATKIIRAFEKFGIMTSYWFLLRPVKTIIDPIINKYKYIEYKSTFKGGSTKSSKRKKKSKTLKKKSKTLKKKSKTLKKKSKTLKKNKKQKRRKTIKRRG